jgi:tyrocidine synthetase-3
VNTVAIRTRPEGSKVFLDFLGEVKEQCLDGFANQHYPFEDLVSDLQLARDPKRNPLFDVFLNVLNFRDWDGSGASGDKPEWRMDSQAKFDMEIYAAERGESLELKLAYDSGLFSESRMEYFVDQLVGLIDQVCSDPNCRLDSYSMIGDDSGCMPDPLAALERPCCESASAAFLRQVRFAPQAIALEDERRDWTYAQLEESARAIAALLPSEGSPVVAIHGERGASYVISMLGVFLRGSVLLTLDHNVAAERVRSMIGQSGASILLQIGDAQSGDIDLEGLPWCARHRLGSDGSLLDSHIGEPRVLVERFQNPDSQPN